MNQGLQAWNEDTQAQMQKLLNEWFEWTKCDKARTLLWALKLIRQTRANK